MANFRRPFKKWTAEGVVSELNDFNTHRIIEVGEVKETILDTFANLDTIAKFSNLASFVIFINFNWFAT
jgi:hypothetical protein